MTPAQLAGTLASLAVFEAAIIAFLVAVLALLIVWPQKIEPVRRLLARIVT